MCFAFYPSFSLSWLNLSSLPPLSRSPLLFSQNKATMVKAPFPIFCLVICGFQCQVWDVCSCLLWFGHVMCMGMWVRMLVSAMGIFYLGFSVWIHVLLHVFYLGFWGYGFEKKAFMFLVWFKQLSVSLFCCLVMSVWVFSMLDVCMLCSCMNVNLSKICMSKIDRKVWAFLFKNACLCEDVYMFCVGVCTNLDIWKCRDQQALHGWRVKCHGKRFNVTSLVFPLFL